MAAELALLEGTLGLRNGTKYGAQGERQIPVLQTNNGPGLTGLITIAAHLVKQAKKEQLLGSTAEEKAVVQQWLEYRVTRVDRCSSKEDTRTILKDLNTHLEDKVYLAGNSFTLADILMYYGLHHVMVDLTVQEKEKYLNVSRWFNHIQHYPVSRTARGARGEQDCRGDSPPPPGAPLRPGPAASAWSRPRGCHGNGGGRTVMASRRGRGAGRHEQGRPRVPRPERGGPALAPALTPVPARR
uniref:Eukaryotic translation elongation factor 1 epsilon-1 n=1 Tax=Anas zonorhyncha TaxID=75864 RepID=A0A8B9U6J5_9AVES